MGHQDDLVDSDTGQLVDVTLSSLDFVEELCGVERARRVHRLVGDVETDERDVFAVAVGLDDPRTDVLIRSGLGQWRTDLGQHVRAQDRGVAFLGRQVVEEVGEAVVATVELVIAEFEGVEADLVHQRGIGLTGEQ